LHWHRLQQRIGNASEYQWIDTNNIIQTRVDDEW
jgi:hypothetical protein